MKQLITFSMACSYAPYYRHKATRRLPLLILTTTTVTM